jgi:hypothetical protein
MQKLYFILCCLLLERSLSNPIYAQTASAWEFKGEKEGIRIYHQKTPGLLHIKLSTSVKAPLSGIVTLFSDVDRYSDWGYKISYSKLLNRVSTTELWYYAKYDFPWPLDDRDIILHSKMEQHPVTRQITIINTPYPTYLPENQGIVRIKKSSTRWNFTPGAGGWVYLEQHLSTDSAADMPDWLIKMTADTGPRETAKAVRSTLLQEKYQKVKLAHIRE